MQIKANNKQNLVIGFGYLWAIAIIALPFISMVFDTRSPNIWAGVAFFYFTYKHSTKPYNEKSFSLLTFWYFFVAISCLAVGFLETFVNANFIYSLLIPVSVVHFFLGKWSYVIPIEEEVLRPGLNQKRIDYQVINFDLTRELISKIKSGNTNVLVSGEYKREVCDAATQAMSEEILMNTLNRLRTLSSAEKNKRQIMEILKQTIDQFGDGAEFQLYPLWADRASYKEYFYKEDMELRQLVMDALDKIDGGIRSEEHKKMYFRNNPCAAIWPIISKFTLRTKANYQT